MDFSGAGTYGMSILVEGKDWLVKARKEVYQS